MPAESSIKTCCLYLPDTLSDWEIAFITAELNSKRYFAKNRNVNLLKIGNTLAPVTTMGGMTVTPDRDIAAVEFQEGDMLILPGADTWADEKHTRILETASGLLARNVTVAAICGATVALARSGLLDGRTHTSNDGEFLKMMCPGYTGSAHYTHKPAVTDGNLITASGFAPLEFSYEVFKKLDVMKTETLDAWFQLHKTREPECFYRLMESLK